MAEPPHHVQVEFAYAGTIQSRAPGWFRIRQNRWVLDVITRGRQRQRVEDGEPFERPSGVLALYMPNTVYYEQQSGMPREGAFVVFSAAAEINAMLRDLCGTDGYVHIDDPLALGISPLQTLGRCVAVRRAGSDLRIHGLMLDILGLLASSVKTGPRRRMLLGWDDDRVTLVERVAKYLNAHIAEPVRIRDLAEEVGMSESAFARAYRKAADESPYHAILRSKMAAAKAILLLEGLSVQQVAVRLGFSNAFNFSRAFKRMEGCSPSRYRQRQEHGG